MEESKKLNLKRKGGSEAESSDDGASSGLTAADILRSANMAKATEHVDGGNTPIDVDGEDDDFTIWNTLWLFLLGFVAFYGLDYFEASSMESVRVPWYIALCYYIGGKNVVAGILWSLGLLTFWFWMSKFRLGSLIGAAIVLGLVAVLTLYESYSYSALTDRMAYFTNR